MPDDVFVSSKPGELLVLKAELVDGRALPAWLRFDARSKTFEGTPPLDFGGKLEIRVTARDSEGHEVDTLFQFAVGEDPTQIKPAAPKPAPGRSSFDRQLRMLAPTRPVLLARTAPDLERMPVRVSR